MLQLKERLQKGSDSDPFVAKARVYMAMLDNPGSPPDPTPDAPDPDDFNNPTNRPGRQASCQHHDLPTCECQNPHHRRSENLNALAVQDL